MDDDNTVEYSVKELLDGISTKLDKVNDKLDQKAEAAELHALQERVYALEGRVEIIAMWRQNEMSANARRDKRLDELTTQNVSDLAVTRYKKWLIGLGVAQFGEVIALIFARHFKL